MKLNKYLFLIIVSLVMLGCKDKITSPDYSSIKNPRERWKAYGFAKYTIEQQRLCFCPFRGNIVLLKIYEDNIVAAKHTDNEDDVNQNEIQIYKTVDELFDFIETLKDGNADSLIVQYDSTYGYPTNIYVDFIKNAVDDELCYNSSNLKPVLFKERSK